MEERKKVFRGKIVDIKLKLKGMEGFFVGRNWKERTHTLFKQCLWSLIPLNLQRKVINFSVTPKNVHGRITRSILK